MVVALRKFLRKYVDGPADAPAEAPEHALQLATAALLVATMTADGETGDDERAAVITTVRSRFGLSSEETNDLLQLAQKKVWSSTGYYEFTSLLNKALTYGEKVKLVEHLWEVAFADARLDRHEDHAVRKISNLIYVEHKDFIDAKLRVKKRAGRGKEKKGRH